MKLFQKTHSFHLELKNIENFDLSSIQLIHALKKNYKDNFTYSIEVKEEIKTILKHAGFEYFIK